MASIIELECEEYHQETTDKRHKTIKQVQCSVKNQFGRDQALKIITSDENKIEIILEIYLSRDLPSIINTIEIYSKQRTYKSTITIKQSSTLPLASQTKSLTLHLIRLLNKYFNNLWSPTTHTAHIDFKTGEIYLKQIIHFDTQKPIGHILEIRKMFKLKQFYFSIVNLLQGMNYLPNLYVQIVQNKMFAKIQRSLESKFEERLAKFQLYSNINFWDSSEQEKNINQFDQNVSQENTIQKQGELRNKMMDMFVFNVFGAKVTKNHKNKQDNVDNAEEQEQKKNIFNQRFSKEEQQVIFIHLKSPENSHTDGGKAFIFNQVEIVEETSRLVDTKMQGAKTKILIQKVKLFYLNFDEKSLNIQKNSPSFTKLLAIKAPKYEGQQNNHLIKANHEIKILQNFREDNNPFFLKYYVTKQENYKFKNYLLMDFVSNAITLRQYISNKKQTFSLSSKLFLMSNFAQALRFLNNKNVVHMDISPNNILVYPNLFIQLIDFGEAYHQKTCDSNYKPGFTMPFTCPEKFYSKTFTPKSDIFSFGIILYYILFQKFPFSAESSLKKSYVNKNFSKKFFFAPQSLNYEGYSKILMRIVLLIDKCLSINPQKRPQPTWIVIILKQIYYWVGQLHACHLRT